MKEKLTRYEERKIEMKEKLTRYEERKIEMKEKLTRYEDVENFILEQINNVHIYRMCYFEDLRNENNWDNYLSDNMNDGYSLIHDCCDKYLFTTVPETFINKVVEWRHISDTMLFDLRQLLIKKYHRHYIHRAIKEYKIKYDNHYNDLMNRGFKK